MSAEVDAEGMTRHRLAGPGPVIVYEARLFSRDYNRVGTNKACVNVEGLWEWCEKNLKAPWMFHEGFDGGAFVLTAAEDASLFKLFWGDRMLYIRDPYMTR